MDQRSAVRFGVLRSPGARRAKGWRDEGNGCSHSTDLPPPSLFSSSPLNENCFPSHSTLICLIVAIGLLPLHRKIGAILIAFVLVAISLPRIYVGGHYPIDVAASAVLAVACYWVVRALSSLARVQTE